MTEGNPRPEEVASELGLGDEKEPTVCSPSGDVWEVGQPTGCAVQMLPHHSRCEMTLRLWQCLGGSACFFFFFFFSCLPPVARMSTLCGQVFFLISLSCSLLYAH